MNLRILRAVPAVLLCAGLAAAANTASAQSVEQTWPRLSPPLFSTAGAPALAAGNETALQAGAPASECPGCPKRRVWLAVGEVLGVNLIYNGVNLLIKPEEEKIYFRVYPKIWWNNISYGFEWDDNTFQVNQFGHPYQGNNYFNTGRANGMTFWESAPLAALGSLTWEYLGERHKPSLNDLLMTTLGGISLGEMFHRTAWLVRNPQKTGKGRFWNEFAAMVIDPVTGLNRFANGDARRVSEKPKGFAPDILFATVDAGVLWRGEDTKVKQASGEPFAQLNLGYGAMAVGNTNTPFDAFRVDMRLGGGGPISEATVRGRLVGRQLSNGPDGPATWGTHFSVVMTYDYQNNSAFQYGGQGFWAVLNHRQPLGSDFSVVAGGGGGVIALGAMDSLYVKGEERQYDFGPGLSYGLTTMLLRKGFPFVRASYTGLWLHTVDGAQVDHVAQTLRGDLLVPIRGPLALGAAAEFVRRKSYYDQFDDLDQKFPQFRLYLSWLNR